MLGKRPRATMRRTSSVSLIGSGPVNGDSARLPGNPHPKESKLKFSHNGGGSTGVTAAAAPATATTPAAGASQPPPRLVIGFHPKVPFYEGGTSTPTALSPDSSSEVGNHRSSALSGVIGGGATGGDGLMMPPPQSSIARRSACQSKSPSGSPRSALGDLLAGGSRPWERKAGGVGLGIVAALNSSNNNNISSNFSLEEENDNKVPVEDGRMYAVPPTANGAYHHLVQQQHSHGGLAPPPHSPIPSSIFAPSRASPPIPIHPSPAPHSDYNCPSHCTHQNCHPASAFGPVSASLRLDPILPEHEPSSFRLGGALGAGAGGGGAGRGGRPIMFSPSPAIHHQQQHHPSPTPRSRLVVHTPATTVMGFGLPWEQQQQNHQMADMEVDRTESLVPGTPPLVSHAGLIRLPPNSNGGSSSSGIPYTSLAGYSSPNFLDACYLCRRRLVEGRDIYILRGDRAFCSQECRSQQIVNIERSEKCSSAVMKVGGGSEVRTTTQRTRVITAGTAAAA